MPVHPQVDGLMTGQASIDQDRRAFLTGKRPIKTEISTACLNFSGIYCQSCRDACDLDAIVFRKMVRGVPVPVIEINQCTACKRCINSCPVSAITIADKPVQEEIQ